MTREEAKEFHIVSPFDRVRYEKFVDYIYDDFESRICGNCKWTNWVGPDDKIYCRVLGVRRAFDFYCKDFEERE